MDKNELKRLAYYLNHNCKVHKFRYDYNNKMIIFNGLSRKDRICFEILETKTLNIVNDYTIYVLNHYFSEDSKTKKEEMNAKGKSIIVKLDENYYIGLIYSEIADLYLTLNEKCYHPSSLNDILLKNGITLDEIKNILKAAFEYFENDVLKIKIKRLVNNQTEHKRNIVGIFN